MFFGYQYQEMRLAMCIFAYSKIQNDMGISFKFVYVVMGAITLCYLNRFLGNVCFDLFPCKWGDFAARKHKVMKAKPAGANFPAGSLL